MRIALRLRQGGEKPLFKRDGPTIAATAFRR
jgi:hypothetical protein